MMEVKLLLIIFVAIFGKLLADPACPMMHDPKPATREKAANQLYEFRKNKKEIDTLTTAYGAPIGDINTLTVGPRGPALLQDALFLEQMAHFARERIPERIVHGKAAGAFGYFKVTNDITKYTGAKLFSEVGKVTPVAVRFSIGAGRPGTADSIRDIRGFAIKFYTEDGNWDLVGLNLPIFFVRDPVKFISIAHGLSKNPVTNLQDADSFWDFLSLIPESLNMLVHFFSDLGIPYSYRFMDGYGINTFKLVNEKREAVYCKFHFKTNKGIKNLSPKKAMKLAGSDPDSSTRDLYNAIANGDYPSWTMYIQVMTFEQAKNFEFNPFDATKFWPEDKYPLTEVGVLTLNKNPSNYFAQVQQIAFAPSSLVWGIEPSPDKVLQGRLFVYPDTQRYRLGTNYLQIPVNNAINVTVRNYERDGLDTVTDNQDGAPNYYPNSFCGPINKPAFKSPAFSTSGDIVDKYDSGNEDNFSQAGTFYREMLKDDEKTRLIQNIANELKNAQIFIQKRAVRNFKQVDSDLGKRLQQELQKLQKMND